MYCFKLYFSLRYSNQTLLTANREQTILIAMLAPRQKGTFDFSTSTTSPCQVVLSGLLQSRYCYTEAILSFRIALT